MSCSRSLEEKAYNLCLLHTVFKEKHWTVLFHIKIADDLRMWHKVDPGSVVQVQDHLKKSLIPVCAISYIHGNDKKGTSDTKIACDMYVNIS